MSESGRPEPTLPGLPSGRFARLPSYLADRATHLRLGDDVPAMIAHPDEGLPAPFVLWMHGRTVNKELDPGRYMRWLRAGIGVVAVDLPGHGERGESERQSAAGTPGVLTQMLDELDGVLDQVERDHAASFDRSRAAIGGMSAGGMVTLRRLCDPHMFVAAAVESTTGDLDALYFPPEGAANAWPVSHDPAAIEPINPSAHLESWRPIPLLALHSEADEMVSFDAQRGFLDRLRGHYERAGADPGLVRLHSWPTTGAPAEHAGFGRVASEAKNLQLAFLEEHLLSSGTSR